MRRYRAPLGPSVTFFAVRSWAGCITNMSEFDLRQAQDAFLKSALRYRLASGFLASALSEVPTRKVHYGKKGEEEDAARCRVSVSRQTVEPIQGTSIWHGWRLCCP